LALIKIEADKPLPYITFGNSDLVRPGQKVIAVGNPFGLGGTVTAGIVSAVGREIGSGPYDDFLQIDAPINRGNSGGPTFNLAFGRQHRHRLRHRLEPSEAGDRRPARRRQG
jgi:serine protease Do